MVKGGKTINRILDKIMYFTGIHQLRNDSRPAGHWLPKGKSSSEKYYHYRASAKNNERHAVMEEKAEGRVSYAFAGRDYELAARMWLKAHEPEKAYSNYMKASEVYARQAESNKDLPEDNRSRHRSPSYGYLVRRSDTAKRRAERLKHFLEGKSHGLEGKTAMMTLSIFCLVLGFLFIEPNISGKIISNQNSTNSSYIGGVFFIIGLIAIIISFILKKK